MKINDKAILVTGSSRGIGYSIAKDLLKREAKVVFTGSKPLDIYMKEKIIEKEVAASPNFYFYQCDFSKPDSIDKLKDKLEFDIDILINNVGTTVVKPFTEISLSEFDNVIDLNFRSVFYTTNLFLDQIIKSKGAVVNILSIAVFEKFLNNSIYAASKAAVDAMMRTLREEMRENHVDIVNVYPGATSTDIWPDDMRKEYADKMMKPDDIANSVSNIIEDLINERLTVEEIVLRPKTGDI